MIKISVAEAKANLSAILSKSAYSNEKFLITRRNKPIAALVSVDDLKIIEQHQERQGLASVVGKWKGFELNFRDSMRTGSAYFGLFRW
jgi:prevent-host-death family protein